MPKDLYALERKLGYSFNNRKILEEALTHGSVRVGANQDIPHHERLEFLGDAVLTTVISEYLFQTEKDASPGRLSHQRQSLISREKQNEIANSLQINQHVEMGRSVADPRNFGRYGEFIEAIIGAVFIDAGGSSRDGVKSAKEVIHKLWELQEPPTSLCCVM